MLKHEDISFDFFNGELLIFTSDEFIFENLENQKTKLADFLVKHFNGRVQVKIIIEKDPSAEKKFKLKDISSGETNLSGYENTLGTSNVNNFEKIEISSKSILEQKIINLFGAEDITGRIEN